MAPRTWRISSIRAGLSRSLAIFQAAAGRLLQRIAAPFFEKVIGVAKFLAGDRFDQGHGQTAGERQL